jgi:hypothetical protein
MGLKRIRTSKEERQGERERERQRENIERSMYCMRGELVFVYYTNEQWLNVRR